MRKISPITALLHSDLEDLLESSFFLNEKFFWIHLEYYIIYNGPKGLHQIASEVEWIVWPNVMNPQLKQIAIGHDFSIH